MKISQNGISLIKQFEGCRLMAYKPVPTEQYWTIGYGHYGPDVAPNSIITQGQADAYLLLDLQKFEKAVNDTKLVLNQNQFDALVSFAYNCGAGNLRKLVMGRTLLQIADAMLLYNKGGGKVLSGLTRRREAERILFLSGSATNTNEPDNHNPYRVPIKNVRFNSKGDDARWLQFELNRRGYKLIVDGQALIDYQKKAGLNPDGIAGPLTKASLKEN